MLHDVLGKIDELNNLLLRNGLRKITGISFDEKTWTRLRADLVSRRPVKEQSMGIITITTAGSFTRETREFSAMDGGHADAVSRAIEYLSAVVLPEAIRNDHKLHDENERPPNKDFGYGRPTDT